MIYFTQLYHKCGQGHQCLGTHDALVSMLVNVKVIRLTSPPVTIKVIYIKRVHPLITKYAFKMQSDMELLWYFNYMLIACGAGLCIFVASGKFRYTQIIRE